MLAHDDLTRRGHELVAELASPRAIFEGLMRPSRPLNRRDVLPGFVVTQSVAPMHGIEDPKLRLPCRVQNLQHMRNTAVRLGDSFDAGPELPAFRDEVVIWIDHQERCYCPIIGTVYHELSDHL